MGPAGGGVKENWLSGFAGFFAFDDRGAMPLGHRLINDYFFDVIAGGNFVHQVEHHAFEQATKCTGSSTFFESCFSQRAKRVSGEVELHSFHAEQFGVLPGQ